MTNRTLSDEDRAFIRAILSDPEDSAARLVYADWLDERDNPRGRFLRLEVELAALPAEHAGRLPLLKQLWELESELDANWIMLIDRPPIENCRTEPLRFQFECPEKWEKLHPTDNEGVRYCDQCRKKVYFCRNLFEAGQHARMGDCVAITTLVVRRQGDLQQMREPGELMGFISPERESHLAEIWQAESDLLTDERKRKRPWWKFW